MEYKKCEVCNSKNIELVEINESFGERICEYECQECSHYIRVDCLDEVVLR